MFWKKRNKNNLIVLCNSWPKSGTHLLLNTVAGIFGNKDSWYNDGAIKSTPDNLDGLFSIINTRIEQHKTNFAMKGHIGFSDEINTFLNKKDISVLFIVRDPRDVICSTVRWVTDLRDNWEVNEYFKQLSKEDQISYAIKGMPDYAPFNNNDSFVLWQESIVDRYKLLTPWSNFDGSCLLKYEELSGNHGKDKYDESIEKILSFLKIDNPLIIQRLKDDLIEKDSSTFHSGKSGEWRKEFTYKNIKEFLDVGGELLVEQFGYESTL